jgi:hypothetical protein
VYNIDDDITLSSSTITTNYGVCRRKGESDNAFYWNQTATTTTTYDDKNTDYNNNNQYGWITSCIFWLHAISFIIMLCMAFVVRNVPEDISDSRHVCHSLCAGCYCTCSLWIIWGIGYAFQNLTIMASSRGLIKSVEVYAFVGYLIFPKIYAVCYEKKNGHLPPPRQPRQQRCCSRNKNVSSPVVGGRGEIRITGVAHSAQQQQHQPSAVVVVVPKKKNRRTLATSITPAFSTVNNDDDDDNNAAAGNNGYNCDDAAAINGSNGEQQKDEHTGTSSSSSILEENNNRSSSSSSLLSQSLKDSDAIANILSDNGIPSKMEDDDDDEDEDDDECDNNNNNADDDDDDEEKWALP